MEYDWELEDAYVRGNMADVHIPKDVRSELHIWNSYLYYGDENQWHIARKFTEVEEKKKLVNALTYSLQSNPQWQLVGNAQWRKQKSKDSFWKISLDDISTDSKEIRVSIQQSYY